MCMDMPGTGPGKFFNPDLIKDLSPKINQCASLMFCAISFTCTETHTHSSPMCTFFRRMHFFSAIHVLYWVKCVSVQFRNGQFFILTLKCMHPAKHAICAHVFISQREFASPGMYGRPTANPHSVTRGAGQVKLKKKFSHNLSLEKAPNFKAGGVRFTCWLRGRVLLCQAQPIHHIQQKLSRLFKLEECVKILLNQHFF